MKRGGIIAGLITMALLTAGCAAIIVGAGTGAGVYIYIEGELRRSYTVDFDQTMAASLQALDHLKIRIESKTADGIKTTLKTKRADGTPVTIKLTKLSPRLTEVGVRSGHVGLWDKDVSELIHATIAKQLP